MGQCGFRPRRTSQNDEDPDSEILQNLNDSQTNELKKCWESCAGQCKVGENIFLLLVKNHEDFGQYFGIHPKMTEQEIRSLSSFSIQANRIHYFLDTVVLLLTRRSKKEMIIQLCRRVGSIHFYRGVNFASETWTEFQVITLQEIMETYNNVNTLQTVEHFDQLRKNWKIVIQLICDEILTGFLTETESNFHRKATPPITRKKFSVQELRSSGLLTSEQTQAMKLAWINAFEREQIGLKLLLHMVIHKPNYGRFFGVECGTEIDQEQIKLLPEIQIQAKRIQGFFDTFVNLYSVHTEDKLKSTCRRIGEIHFNKGVNFTADIWLLFKRTTIELVLPSSPSSSNDKMPLAAIAWDKMMRCIIYEMKEGFLQKARSKGTPDHLHILSNTTNGHKRREAEFVWQNYHLLFMIFWNGSDASIDFCIKVINGGIIEELLKLLERKDFYPQKLGDDECRNFTVQAVLGLLHNFLRLHHYESKKRFRKSNGVRLVRDYIISDDPLICAKATMVLAFGIHEEEVEVINSKKDIIKFIVQLLEDAMKDRYHRAEGFLVEEIIDGLNSLSINDKNKLRIVHYGALRTYMKVMTQHQNNNELRMAVKGFWILSFIPQNIQIIRKIPGCLTALGKLQSNRNVRIARAATGALWNLNSVSRPGTTTAKRKSTNFKMDGEKQSGHVMISYDHHHKEIISQLNDCLKEAHFRTWFDADKMSGSTLDSMAKAIENAAVIIICMSDRYKNSPSCRTEAEYAYRLQKHIIPVRTEYKYKPDGWLGILLGTKLYFDCYTIDQVDNCCERVIKELGNRGKTINGENLNLASTHGMKQPNTVIEKNGKAVSWTKDEVQKWLKENQFGHIAAKFNKFDGKLLMELKTMYKVAPIIFYRHGEKDLGLTELTDLLKFTWCLDRIK